jgi:hypothetical protein
VSRERVEPRFTADQKTSDPVEDFEKSLRFAEELQAKIVEADSQILSLRFRVGVVALVLVLGSSLTINLWLTNANFNTIFSFIISSTAIVALALVYAVTRIGKVKSRVEPDKKLLEDLIDLIHETERSITGSGELSTLARETLRIRLARFGIGKKSWE